MIHCLFVCIKSILTLIFKINLEVAALAVYKCSVRKDKNLSQVER